MPVDPPVLLVLERNGPFALNGALTTVRAAYVDIVGVITLGMITALGGTLFATFRLGALPPATFVRSLAPSRTPRQYASA
jgi:uncharacterized membrane protein YeiH